MVDYGGGNGLNNEARKQVFYSKSTVAKHKNHLEVEQSRRKQGALGKEAHHGLTMGTTMVLGLYPSLVMVASICFTLLILYNLINLG